MRMVAGLCFLPLLLLTLTSVSSQRTVGRGSSRQFNLRSSQDDHVGLVAVSQSSTVAPVGEARGVLSHGSTRPSANNGGVVGRRYGYFPGWHPMPNHPHVHGGRRGCRRHRGHRHGELQHGGSMMHHGMGHHGSGMMHHGSGHNGHQGGMRRDHGSMSHDGTGSDHSGTGHGSGMGHHGTEHHGMGHHGMGHHEMGHHGTEHHGMGHHGMGHHGTGHHGMGHHGMGHHGMGHHGMGHHHDGMRHHGRMRHHRMGRHGGMGNHGDSRHHGRTGHHGGSWYPSGMGHHNGTGHSNETGHYHGTVFYNETGHYHVTGAGQSGIGSESYGHGQQGETGQRQYGHGTWHGNGTGQEPHRESHHGYHTGGSPTPQGQGTTVRVDVGLHDTSTTRRMEPLTERARGVRGRRRGGQRRSSHQGARIEQ